MRPVWPGTAFRQALDPSSIGLALPAFAGLDDALSASNTVGLIHHPTSLESGFSESERTTLLALEQRLVPRLTRIIVTSEPTADRLVADYRVNRDRIRVIVPGTDDARRSTGSNGPTCHILSIGTLIPRKGHDLLLRAVARLFDLDWHLTIVVGHPSAILCTLMRLLQRRRIRRRTGRFARRGDQARA